MPLQRTRPSPTNGLLFPRRGIEAFTTVGVAHDLSGSTAPELKITPFVAEAQTLRLGYGTHQGSELLRTNIAKSCNISADDVLTVPGATFGLFLIALTTIRPGERAILVRPGYPPAQDVLKALRTKIEEHRLSFGSAYRLDLPSLEKRLSPSVRLVSLATPHNPSGIAISPANLARLAERVKKRAPGAVLVIDETFREASYQEPEIKSAASLGGPVACVGSLSKVYGVPGLRVGWIATRNRRLMRALVRAKANLLHSGSVFDEGVATSILEQRGLVLGQQRALIAERLAIIERWVEEYSALVEWTPPEAGAIACLRLRQERFDPTARGNLMTELERRSVAVASGPLFGDSPSVFRIGFGANSLKGLGESLEALGGALRATTLGRVDAPSGEGKAAVVTRQLSDRTLPKSEWTHEAHLAVCLFLLKQHSSAYVSAKLPKIIRSYNESVGTPNNDHSGFHATITEFYVRSISRFLRDNDDGQSVDELVQALLDTPIAHREYPLRYYTRDCLFSRVARRSFVEPDRAALKA